MELTGRTRLSKLLKAHPFLLDFLARYKSEFEKLPNPAMRNTIGRVATLSMVASMGDVPLDRLIRDLESEIVKHGSSGDDQPAVGEREESLEELKAIIRDLHAGGDFEKLKRRFEALAKDISPGEIAEMEQELVAEGMPETEIRRLCDVHAAMFQSALSHQAPINVPAGHPVHTFIAENRAIRGVADRVRAHLSLLGDPPDASHLAAVESDLASDLEKLAEVEKHYQRKEYQLFPFVEKRGFTAPPKVMWQVHDDVRAMLKATRSALSARDAARLVDRGTAAVQTILDMMYKEENILFPMALELLSADEWAEMRRGEHEIGYALVVPLEMWTPGETVDAQPKSEPSALQLEVGALSPEQVNLLLKHLPLDATFVDENDEVRYYVATDDRIFPRSPGVIGRKVQNCHPPKSIHIVNRILSEFRTGARDTSEFWIRHHGRFIHIRYVAVRDDSGRYRGTLETMQDITRLRSLEGERRLLDWDEERKTVEP